MKHLKLGRFYLFALLTLTWFSMTAPASAADSAVVFMYHRFGEGDFPSTNTTLDQFDAHLHELTSGGYTVWPLHKILGTLQSGKPLPDKTVALTIDDAYLSVLTEAWPRLKKAGFPVTLFLSTDLVDARAPSYLNWDQVRDLVRQGLSVGGHTATHLHMAEADGATIRDELDRSANRFLKELGFVPKAFAFPYGEASLAAIDEVKKAGYNYAFGQHSGAIGRTSDLFYLPRFALNEKYGGLKRFREAARMQDIPVGDVTPKDMLVGDENPPHFGFTVAEPLEGMDQLACYASHEGKADLEKLGDFRIEVRLEKPLPTGRTRVNCTMPGTEGRWRWFGWQFYVPNLQ